MEDAEVRQVRKGIGGMEETSQSQNKVEYKMYEEIVTADAGLEVASLPDIAHDSVLDAVY